MLLTLSPRKPDQLVNYNLSNPIAIEKETVSLNIVNFQMLLKEVKRTPKRKLKEYQKTIKTFLMTMSSFAILPLNSMANSQATTTSSLPKTSEGLPPELLELLLQLLTIAVAGGIIIAAIMLVVTGVGKMFRIKGITQWTSDILKGLFQVLAAVPVVFLIYYLATLLFKGSGWFVTPF
jgi:hypothetical protein